MLIQINEQFHDYPEQTYFVESERLDASNPVDFMVLEASKSGGFNQEVFIDVDEKRESDSTGVWEEPHLSADSKVEFDGRPDKLIKLTIFFDC